MVWDRVDASGWEEDIGKKKSAEGDDGLGAERGEQMSRKEGGRAGWLDSLCAALGGLTVALLRGGGLPTHRGSTSWGLLRCGSTEEGSRAGAERRRK